MKDLPSKHSALRDQLRNALQSIVNPVNTEVIVNVTLRSVDNLTLIKMKVTRVRRLRVGAKRRRVRLALRRKQRVRFKLRR